MFDRFDWWGYAILAAVPVVTFMTGVLWARRELREGRDPAGADSFTVVGLSDSPDAQAKLMHAEVRALSKQVAHLERALRDRVAGQQTRIPTPI